MKKSYLKITPFLNFYYLHCKVTNNILNLQIFSMFFF
nr:MAG TPA: hypothetical protein [Caudoviricetes sp.]